MARNNSKKTRTRLEAAVSQLAELEAQVNSKQNYLNMTCSYQASRLRGTSNSPDKPAGDPQWPPSPPPRPEQTTPGPVGLPPPSLPPRNSVTSMADLGAPLPPPRVPCQSLPPPPPSKGATRHGSAESLTSPGPPPPARRNSQVMVTMSQVVLSVDVLPQVSPTSPQRPPVSHGRSTSSPVSLEATLAAASISNSDNSGVGGGRKSPRYETPPGTPPPPYVTEPELVTWGGLTGGSTSRPIITMEDTDTEDEEGQQAKE